MTNVKLTVSFCVVLCLKIIKHVDDFVIIELLFKTLLVMKDIYFYLLIWALVVPWLSNFTIHREGPNLQGVLDWSTISPLPQFSYFFLLFTYLDRFVLGVIQSSILITNNVMHF